MMQTTRYDYAGGCMEEMLEGEYVKYDEIKYLFKLQKQINKLQEQVQLLTKDLSTVYDICSPYYEREDS